MESRTMTNLGTPVSAAASSSMAESRAGDSSPVRSSLTILQRRESKL